MASAIPYRFANVRYLTPRLLALGKGRRNMEMKGLACMKPWGIGDLPVTPLTLFTLAARTDWGVVMWALDQVKCRSHAINSIRGAITPEVLFLAAPMHRQVFIRTQPHRSC
jgi:hypothetical protein